MKESKGSMKLLGAMSVLVLFALVLPPAQAQTTIAVDLNRAKLTWQWAQGAAPDDGMAAEFRMKCGPTAGNYTKVTTISNPVTREIAVKDAITGSGNWFCVVTAANQFGDGVKSGVDELQPSLIVVNPCRDLSESSFPPRSIT